MLPSCPGLIIKKNLVILHTGNVHHLAKILLVLWVFTYQSTQCHTPEQCYLNIHCHEKLYYQNVGCCYDPHHK